MSGALDGIVVLDMTTALSGPFCSMLLGDLGANVIKIELPGSGDGVRKWGPPFADDSGATYIGFNRNKRSVTIDLHTEEGVAQFRQLARHADVVVENFRPGTMHRFGLDYEVLRAERPDLVYCAISGYGQEGPLAQQPAMDLMIQAISGMMAITGEPDGAPVKAAAPIADLMGGFSGAFSILAALHERERTGEGRRIDISMLDAMLVVLGQSVVAYTMSGAPPTRLGNAHALMAPYQAFATATRGIVISLANEKRWRLLCTLDEFSALLDRPGYEDQKARNRNRTILCAELQQIFSSKDGDYWLERLQSLGLPVAPVNTLPEILEHPHVAARGTLMTVEYPPGSGNAVRIPAPAWRDVARQSGVLDPPTVGQHTEEVFRQFGVTVSSASGGNHG